MKKMKSNVPTSIPLLRSGLTTIERGQYGHVLQLFLVEAKRVEYSRNLALKFQPQVAAECIAM